MSEETAREGPETAANPSSSPPQQETEGGASVQAVQTGGDNGADFGELVFNADISIFPSRRIAHYDKGPVKAYAAQGASDRFSTNLFAMISEDHLTPRLHKTGNYAAIVNPSLPRLVASGIVDWTPEGRERYCFIYENILGQPVLKNDCTGGMGLRPDYVLNAVIKPLIGVLADMRNKEIIHGNIRLSNIYDGGSKNFDRAILGECLSVPPSWNQPVLYEPIDRALCSPIGRGPGTQQDDLYSLGVCLAVMLRNADPMEGLDDQEIIERKMDEGSYAVLLGKERLSGALLELMRGLLYDDAYQRWSMDEVLAWIDGRRLSPKQSARRSKAARPLLLHDKKYIRPEILARDMFKYTNEAYQVIENGDMEQWLSRALEDKATTARFEKAVQLSEEGGMGAGHVDRLVTRVAISLHPEGPMRYKSISVFPDGIGAALTEAYMMKRDLNTYVDFFMSYFITQWVDSQPRAVHDINSMVSRFDGARAYLRNKSLGAGLEKCIYSLNPEVHCLSEKLKNYFVRNPEDLMNAFEKMATSPGRPALFFDRHIAAFMSVKDRKNIDPYLHDMNQTEMNRRVLAEARTLATIQKRSGMGRFPGIAGWIADNLDPVYERFHDRELRQDIRAKIDRIKDSGDLGKVVHLFDNPAIYEEDHRGFRKAMGKYYDLQSEGQEIGNSLLDESTHGQDSGHRVSALFSSALAIVIVLIIYFSNAG